MQAPSPPKLKKLRQNHFARPVLFDLLVCLCDDTKDCQQTGHIKVLNNNCQLINALVFSGSNYKGATAILKNERHNNYRQLLNQRTITIAMAYNATTCEINTFFNDK